MRNAAVIRTLPLLLVTCLIAALTGCGTSPVPDQAPEAAAGGRLFGVTYQTMNNPFFVDLDEGLRAVIEARGDRLITLDAQWNSLKQKNDVSDLILQEASGIFINPVNWEGIKGSLLQAKRKNIPCIVVDAPAKDMDLVLCTVASDNVEAGRLACRALAKVDPNAQVVILHLSVNKACIDRVAGFEEEVANHPGMKVLDIQEGKGTTEGGRPVMRDLLGRYPDLNAVFPINDPSALGAISALESAGKLDQVTVVTVDGSQEGIKAIQSGKLLSTSAQFPEEIGRTAAEKMYEHLEGKPVEKEVKVRVELIASENADDYLKDD
jgi:ribose transport system substrate-binding protein